MSQPIATNRKAYRDYEIVENVECGIELKGSEVKSLRAGRVNLEGSFARVESEGVMLYNMHVSPYEQASYLNVEPIRARRLLLHKKQISKLAGQTSQRGFTLVPLKIYFNARGFAKLELGLCRGRKLYDRREAIKRKEADRQMSKTLKYRRNR